MRERTRITDRITSLVTSGKTMGEKVRMSGIITVSLWDLDGNLVHRQVQRNLLTQVGDQFYGERAAGVGSLGPVTGMKLGTGTTAPAKTGAGAHIVTYLSGSHQALAGGFPASSLEGTARRITYESFWAAGTATANDITEAIITLQDALADNAGVAGDTIARGILSPTVNKAADQALTITWDHDLEAV